MYFGVDYHPEQWVFPYAGTAEQPEAQWETDAELMAAARRLAQDSGKPIFAYLTHSYAG